MTVGWILGISVSAEKHVYFSDSVSLRMLEADYVRKKPRGENRDSVQSELFCTGRSHPP